MVAPIIIGALIGAAMGAAQSADQDSKRRTRMKHEGVKERYSPWTKQRGVWQPEVDTFGNIVNGAGMGMAMGQQFKASPTAKDVPGKSVEGGANLVYPTDGQGKVIQGPPAEAGPPGSPGNMGGLSYPADSNGRAMAGPPTEIKSPETGAPPNEGVFVTAQGQVVQGQVIGGPNYQSSPGAVGGQIPMRGAQPNAVGMNDPYFFNPYADPRRRS